jgi:hypothetical protein
MSDAPKDQRRHQRLNRPFDGTWRGASGGAPCRVTDLSIGGCYVQSIALPMKNEETEVSIVIGQETLSLVGRVVYAEPHMGFAVEFHSLSDEQAKALQSAIDARRVQPS